MNKASLLGVILMAITMTMMILQFCMTILSLRETVIVDIENSGERWY
jgi:hypothetical protein